ncbi:hypothetical protein KSP39_PZI005520 [Platanthera zijinensis]|uniref:DUF4005 domain-containing protein n=1 Tax=Platanthera zijinensis TaxID=2320716 RepID=A0AAP0BRV7_9ASPA
MGTLFSSWHEESAAIRIQSAFRGYLVIQFSSCHSVHSDPCLNSVLLQARKAFRALKALVQLQALVRGYLVRKKTEAVLRCGRAAARSHSGDRRSGNFVLSSQRGILHFSDEKCRCCSSAAQSAPRILKSPCTAPATPTKVGPDEFRRLLGCPNYMASTQSFVAKVRSQSTLREASPRMMPAADEAVALGVLGTRRSCSQIPEAVRLRRAVMEKLLERAAAGELIY